MKRKKMMTSALLVLCAIIWGTIAWKVYSAMNKETPVELQAASAKAKPQPRQTALLLNYRDPFLGDYKTRPSQRNEVPDSVKSSAKKKHQLSQKQPPEAKQIEEMPPNIQYKGIIRMGTNTKAIVCCNGQTQMLKCNDPINKYVIKSITDKTLIISCKNKKHTILLQ